MRAWILILGSIIAINSYAYEKVFYCTYQSNECVEPNAPVAIKNDEIDELIERVGVMKNNFIGLIDADGTTLQFFVDAINEIWMEIPAPSEKGSYGKQIKEAEMRSIIRNLEAPYLTYKKTLNLNFLAW